MAQETVEDGYEYDDWSETRGIEEFDELFENNFRKFFDDFREEFKRILKEKTSNQVKFEVVISIDKQEKFEQFLKIIEADFKKI